MDIKRIRIKNKSKISFWYNKLVGKEFNVVEAGDVYNNYYYVVENGEKTMKLISKNNCENI